VGTWLVVPPRKLSRQGLGRPLPSAGLLGKWARRRSWAYFGYIVPRYPTTAPSLCATPWSGAKAFA
jgi:hypothetical protein